MPLTYTVQKSPKDRVYLRTVSSGLVSAEDSAALMKNLGPGQPHFGAAMLSIVEPGTEYTPEARKTFTGNTNTTGQQSPIAVVVPSAALRVLISFVIRISGAAAHTKFFSTEDDAKKWLFSVLDA